LTPQGGGEAPKNLSGRLVAATWWLFGFIIIASYTANLGKLARRTREEQVLTLSLSLAAFLTVSRLDIQIETLEDLIKQYKTMYGPVKGSTTMVYFKRMAEIEEQFYNRWKDMSLDDTLSPVNRSKLAVWDYPVSDKYSKIWQSLQETRNVPESMEEAVNRVRASSHSTGFALLGDATDIRYQMLMYCDLRIVGDEFSRKPYAIAVQQGSPLKEQFDDA